MGVPESCKLKLIVQKGTVQNSLKKYCQTPFKDLGSFLILSFIDLPMKMEPTESSETSAFSTRTPGRYPKENALHLGSSSLKRMLFINSESRKHT